MQVDLRVLELLSSKICHDLVSPVSAINNGVELIEEIGGSVVDEAIKLISASSSHAARRLRLFRMAYGRAGSEENIPVKDVRTVVESYLSAGKAKLTWPQGVPNDDLCAHRGTLKTLVNVMILAEEILPYGGTVQLRALDEFDSLRLGCVIEIVGRNAQLTDVMQAAMENSCPVEDLTPRTIQAYMTGKFAGHFGLRLSSRQIMADKLELALSIAPVTNTRPEYDGTLVP